MKKTKRGRTERPIELTPEEGVLFWRKLNGSGEGCWEWPGRRKYDGYGIHQYGGQSRMAHRIAYTLTYGPIPGGFFVCHRCDNSACCNPKHLFVGTNSDNMKDMVSKGRHSFAVYPDQIKRGEDNGNSKLTELKVREIFRMRHEGATIKMISTRTSMHYNTIKRILQRKLWAHVDLA